MPFPTHLQDPSLGMPKTWTQTSCPTSNSTPSRRSMLSHQWLVMQDTLARMMEFWFQSLKHTIAATSTVTIPLTTESLMIPIRTWLHCHISSLGPHVRLQKVYRTRLVIALLDLRELIVRLQRTTSAMSTSPLLLFIRVALTNFKIVITIYTPSKALTLAISLTLRVLPQSSLDWTADQLTTKASFSNKVIQKESIMITKT